MSLLGLPPLFTLVIALGVVAYLVYHIVVTGTVQPLTVIFLALAIFFLIRVLFLMWRKTQVRENNDD